MTAPPHHPLAGVAVDKALGMVVRVRLGLFPADPGVRSRHPEMEHLWEFHKLRNGYRQPLGSHANIIQQIESVETDVISSVRTQLGRVKRGG